LTKRRPGGTVYFYCRGQKVMNLRRNPVVTVLVDRNERFPELVGCLPTSHTGNLIYPNGSPRDLFLILSSQIEIPH